MTLALVLAAAALFSAGLVKWFARPRFHVPSGKYMVTFSVLQGNRHFEFCKRCKKRIPYGRMDEACGKTHHVPTGLRTSFELDGQRIYATECGRCEKFVPDKMMEESCPK